MSRRLQRIFPDPELSKNLEPLIGDELDIVTKDHRVHHLTLKKVDSDRLYGINLRGKKEVHPLKSIREVILHTH